MRESAASKRKRRRIVAALLLVLLLLGCVLQIQGPDVLQPLESAPVETAGSGAPLLEGLPTEAVVPSDVSASLEPSEPAVDPQPGDPTGEPQPSGSAVNSQPGNPAVDPTPGSTAAGSQTSSAPSDPQGDTSPAVGTTPPAAQTTPPGNGAASASGGLRVVGTNLVDKNGKIVQLRGVSTHGLAWYPGYVNEAFFRQLHNEWGVNVVRLAMYTAESGGYCTGGDQAALKQLIRNGVRYAANQGMYVIIDWHILSDGNPNTHLSQAKAFFNEVSAEYAGYDHVIYEICNEPNGGTSWSQIKSYAEQIIQVIRKNDKDAVILVGTPNWSQYVDQAAADPIRGYDNIMYTLHFYAATHTDDLRNKMVAAVKAGLPIFVSEYGICDASGSGAINETQANLWVKTMDQYHISYVAWNLSNKNETSAIFKTSCTKTSGFSQSDLSASGRWLYQMLTGKHIGGDQPTESPAPAVSPAPSPSPSPSPTPQPSSPGVSSAPAAGEVVWTSGGLEITAELRSSWEADGKPVYLYDLTVRNTSGTACSSWSIDVPFGGSFTLMNGWNGNFTVNGKTLRITSMDYNGTIAAGASTEGIGFIVSGQAIAA